MLATMAAALVCVWIAVIVWQGHVSRQAALQQAEDFTQSMYDATMAGLTGMMVTGTVGQRDSGSRHRHHRRFDSRLHGRH